MPKRIRHEQNWATFRAMDRTAIASIIIGLGATVAAMVMPLKYPNAPKWAIDLSWWGGVLLIIAGGLYLLTEFTIGDVGGTIIETLGWLFDHTMALLRLPASWIAIAFAGGIAARHWFSPIWKKLPAIRSPGPRVVEWLTPIQAVERFVAPELRSKDQLAHERANQFRAKVQSLEAELTAVLELDRSAVLREQLVSAIRERDDANYLAKQRRTDTIEFLTISFRCGLLVGKGCKMTKKRGVFVKEKESYIPANFWGIRIDKTDILDLNLGRALGYLGQYEGVLIGKNKNFKTPPRSTHPGLVVDHS